LGQHLVGFGGALPPELATRYLSRFWAEPCYDAWEENPYRLHTSTLASVYGGLEAMGRYFLCPRGRPRGAGCSTTKG
jgi:hypothetical protein